MARRTRSRPPRLTPPSSEEILRQGELRRQFQHWQRNCHGPAWRFQTAASQAAHGARTRNGCSDPLVQEISEYLALKAQGPRGVARAERRFPLLAAAERLNADDAQTSRLKLMVLADLPPAEIARRHGGDGRILELWERFFFDVRDLRPALDWLSAHVVEPEAQRGNRELAAQMRLAMVAGPAAVAVLLDAPEQAPLGEAERVLRRQMRLCWRLEMLAEMPLSDPAQEMQWLQLQTRLLCETQRVNLALERLRVRCREGERRHELALERLRRAEPRDAERSSQRRRRTSQPAARPARCAARRESESVPPPCSSAADDRRLRDDPPLGEGPVRPRRNAARNAVRRPAEVSEGGRP